MNDNTIFKLFPEPVFKYKLKNFKDLNEEFLKYVYKLRDDDKEGLKKSNKGGWFISVFFWLKFHLPSW